MAGNLLVPNGANIKTQKLMAVAPFDHHLTVIISSAISSLIGCENNFIDGFATVRCMKMKNKEK